MPLPHMTNNQAAVSPITPWLLQHLFDKYTEDLQAGGKTVKDHADGSIHDVVGDFLDFALSYLDEHRPAESFPMDANLGVVLTNHVRVAVCPPLEDNRGTMQDSGAVNVTKGMSQPGLGGMAAPGSAIDI